MTDEKSLFKASLKFGWGLLKGLLIPFSAGLLMYTISYPLNWYSCKSYAESIEHPFRYRFFSCYIATDKGKYLEKTEYQAQQVGMKLILATP